MGQQNDMTPGEGPLRLRAHHLLCALGFRGLGYNDAFVENMCRVVELLRSEPETKLRLIDTVDCICEACPHNVDQECRRGGKGEKAAQRDRAMLERLNFLPPAVITVGSAYDRVREKITPEMMSEEICMECEWETLGHCQEGLEKLKSDDAFDFNRPSAAG